MSPDTRENASFVVVVARELSQLRCKVSDEPTVAVVACDEAKLWEKRCWQSNLVALVAVAVHWSCAELFVAFRAISFSACMVRRADLRGNPSRGMDSSRFAA